MEKKTSSANRIVLKQILGQEGNNRCADCKTATHPRWASWNIGILICIRCSGVHRSLGTHISKVRSIDLDTWNDQQLEKLKVTGNIRSNAFYEAKLPDNYVPDESKIVSFIKTKYELKRWVPADDDDAPLATKAPNLPPKVREFPTRSVDLLDLDGSFNLSKTGSAAKPSPASVSTASAPLSTSGVSSYRASPVSSSPTTPTVNNNNSSSSTLLSSKQHAPTPAQRQSTQSSAGSLFSSSDASLASRQSPTANNRADVKKSILSLYSQPSRQPSTSSTPSLATPSFNLTPSKPASAASSTVSLPSSVASQPSQPSQPAQPASSTNLASAAQQSVDEEDNFANIWN